MYAVRILVWRQWKSRIFPPQFRQKGGALIWARISRTLRVMPRIRARHDQPTFSAALDAADAGAFASPACVKAKAKKQPLV